MYLISIYFDDKTDKRIRGFMKQVALKSGNTCMLDGNVPPHITISAFEARNIEEVMETLEHTVKSLKKGKVQWASVSVFLPHVIYLSPVLSKYLHGLSENIFQGLRDIPDIKIRPYYQPFSWMPHTTVGKKLTREEMKNAFEALQNSFGMFEGEAVKIGLAKTGPYEDIRVWTLGGAEE